LAQYRLNQTAVVLKRADITEEDVDAIVNAANTHLQHGGGVAGAIVRKGGSVIQHESDRIAPVPVGQAAITSAGALRAKHVIHAVGPRMGEGDEEAKLQNATMNSLRVAEFNHIYSLAFPAISTGIFGYPVESCAQIMLSVVRQYCNGETAIREVRFCLFDDATLSVFDATAARIFHA
jgi:O-acetyl-ADP-ribose deacetylase